MVSEIFLITTKYWSISKFEWYFKNTNIHYAITLFSSKVPYYFRIKIHSPFSWCSGFQDLPLNDHPTFSPSSLACAPAHAGLGAWLGVCTTTSTGCRGMSPPTFGGDCDSTLKTQPWHHIIQERCAHLPPFSFIPRLCWDLGLCTPTFLERIPLLRNSSKSTCMSHLLS